jgi:hypothetical protein
MPDMHRVKTAAQHSKLHEIIDLFAANIIIAGNSNSNRQNFLEGGATGAFCPAFKMIRAIFASMRPGRYGSGNGNLSKDYKKIIKEKNKNVFM